MRTGSAPKSFIWEITVILNPARLFPREQPHAPGCPSWEHFRLSPWLFVLHAGCLGEPAALWLWERGSGWSHGPAGLCRDCPSDCPIVTELPSDTVLAHGNSGTRPGSKCWSKWCSCVVSRESKPVWNRNGFWLQAPSRFPLDHRGVTGIGLAGAVWVPSPVEHRDRVPRHGPGVTPDPLRWDLRLNWRSWKRVWEQGSRLQGVCSGGSIQPSQCRPS